jgi:hypothetical protein
MCWITDAVVGYKAVTGKRCGSQRVLHGHVVLMSLSLRSMFVEMMNIIDIGWPDLRWEPIYGDIMLACF